MTESSIESILQKLHPLSRIIFRSQSSRIPPIFRNDQTFHTTSPNLTFLQLNWIDPISIAMIEIVVASIGFAELAIGMVVPTVIRTVYSWGHFTAYIWE